MKLNVGTYNIRLGIQEGLDKIAAVARPYDLDILAVQEIGDRWTMGPGGHSTVELATQLDMVGKFVPAIEEQGARYGTALLTRLQIQEFGVYVLPEEFDESRRMARTVIAIDEQPIVVYSTHLSHIEDREAQWDTVLDLVFGEDDPVLLMGDLNEEPDHWAIQELKNVFVDADPADRFTFPAIDPIRRIDYLFASVGKFVDTSVDDNNTASDHRLVTTTWVIE